MRLPAELFLCALCVLCGSLFFKTVLNDDPSTSAQADRA